MTTRARRPSPPLRGAFHEHEGERSRFAESSGILRSLPDAVAVPHDADDVAALVRWASETRSPLVPRAAGTGMPGGNLGPGVAVDLLTDFRTIQHVDAARQRARVEPGVTRAELNAACMSHGLFFPVDPSSGERCTFGGMLANNSAGAHSVRYGATRDWVESLDLVLADGSRTTLTRGERPDDPRLQEILRQIDHELLPQRETIEAAWPRVRKNSSGYALREYLRSGDAVDLLVGSEGTLALIVGAEVRLAPIPPYQGLALLEFTALEDAGAAVEAVLGLEPATCEMLDRTFLELVRTAGADTDFPLRPGLEAILLVEVEGGSPEEVHHHLDRIATGVEGLADRTVTAANPQQQERMWHVRHAASPLIAQRSDGRVSMQFIEDGVVPIHRLPDYIRALRRVLAAHDIPAVIFGHAGDGNLHVNPLVDVTRARWKAQVEAILYEIADVVAQLGGTLAGEHGDGRLRAPLLQTVWGDAMVERFRHVKNVFDPLGILNPGVILPLPGQRPLEALKSYGAPR